MKIVSGTRVGDWLDGAATCASVACLVHCLLLPLIFGLLPVLSASLDPGDRFHTLVLIFAIPTSGLALVPGWRRSGANGPLAMGGAGLLLLAIAVMLDPREAVEVALTVPGSLLLAGAHVRNWRLRRACCHDLTGKD